MVINGKTIEKTYFIADIAANHDGDINRALKLIELAANSGADCVKFQHHNVDHYVSKEGFESLGGQFSHQSKWKKPVFEVYKDAQVPINWTLKLSQHAAQYGVDFMTTPYDLHMVDVVEPYICGYKIGSGDLNWDAMMKKVAEKINYPIIISTGASDMREVLHALSTLRESHFYHSLKNVCVMQCNTNYTGDVSNFDYLNLKVIQTYREKFKSMFPEGHEIEVGFSDHTPGHTAVLGAVTLGAKLIEKHFTDDTSREGPDHAFSMTPDTWKDMVDNVRLLERALGDGIKCIEDNEIETYMLQRRACRIKRDVSAGEYISLEDVEFQRPGYALHDDHNSDHILAVIMHQFERVSGREGNEGKLRVSCDLKKGDALRWRWKDAAAEKYVPTTQTGMYS